jgi:glycine amidinotransferase/scyllo-inosamine-4-phosphate amidinotransferase 1
VKIHSYNEWSPLKEVVVGTARGANWPSTDLVFAQESKKTTWTETPVPSGAVPQWIINETEEDLEGLCDILRQAGAVVHRPIDRDFVATQGMYNYCPRDRLIIAGNRIIDPAMMYPCRDQEIETLINVTRGNQVINMPRTHGMILDAANVLRMDGQWLFLQSSSGSVQAYKWLCETLPDIDIELCNFYAGVHIDSTIAVLCPGVVVLNGSRVTEASCPRAFKHWTKIYIQDVVAQDFYQYPYASKWIGLNMFSIDPRTVIVDAAQRDIIKKLEQMKFTVIPHTLRHSRTLGGGFHCVTLDTWRQND